MLAVLTVEVEEQLMDLVTQPRRFGQRPVALRHQQIEDSRLILGGDRWQRRGFPGDQQGDGVRIQPVTLPQPPRAPPALCRPARIDFVDGFASADQVLRQPAAVVPRPLDASLARRAQVRRPRHQVRPCPTAVRPVPAGQLAARRIQRNGDMPSLVRVHPDRDHRRLAPGKVARLPRRQDSLGSQRGDRLYQVRRGSPARGRQVGTKARSQSNVGPATRAVLTHSVQRVK
jgi:hypothetical protein